MSSFQLLYKILQPPHAHTHKYTSITLWINKLEELFIAFYIPIWVMSHFSHILLCLFRFSLVKKKKFPSVDISSPVTSVCCASSAAESLKPHLWSGHDGCEHCDLFPLLICAVDPLMPTFHCEIQTCSDDVAFTATGDKLWMFRHLCLVLSHTRSNIHFHYSCRAQKAKQCLSD